MNTFDQFSLKDKTVVVVGGEGLLGKVACETVRELGGTAISIDTHVGANYVCDVTDLPLYCRKAGYISPVHAVVYCVVGNQKPVTFPMSGWASDIEHGLTGAANTATVFRDELFASKGSLVFIGSDLSLVAPDPERYGDLYKPASYSVVKHGIVGLTRYYAALWGKHGARVNCLCPGSIDQGQAVPRCPLGRLAQPYEMKGPLAFLMSQASSYMTGSVMVVDGGMTCW